MHIHGRNYSTYDDMVSSQGIKVDQETLKPMVKSAPLLWYATSIGYLQIRSRCYQNQPIQQSKSVTTAILS